MSLPRISICVPIYGMTNATKFLKRNLDSIQAQTFKDYEIVVSDDSDDDNLKIFCYKYPVQYFKNPGKHNMADNTNHAISKAKGELIKILYQDDYFYDENSLQDIVKHFIPSAYWLVTGCAHDEDGIVGKFHEPFYSESDNTIGSPSVLTIRRDVKERFDNQFYWVLDLDLYKRLFRYYGKPKILNKINVVIGIGEHQTTHRLSDIRKALEHRLLKEKYENPLRPSSV